MKPEFIILPILAYGSLFFIKNSKSEIRNPKQYQNSKYKIQNNLTIKQSNNGTIVFFALLGLLGAFLAKGANEPFGIVNLWMFEHIPGFAMFRDPTKFYILIALSYSVLIPFSVYSIYNWLNSKFKVQNAKLQFKIQNYLPNLFLTFTILYLIFIIRPLWLDYLNNKFKPREVPQEYIQLKQFLFNQNEFFRTLWIPQWQRFGYFSNNHPAIGREEILKGDAKIQINELKKQSSEKMLRELSVKYIIIPFDSEGEIFLRDRRYDNNQYLKTIGELKQIKWLKQVNCSIVKLLNCYDDNPFGKIAVFEVQNPRDHFWIESRIKNQESGIKHQQQNQTAYIVNINNAKKGDMLVFSENYDKYWEAKIHNSSFIISNSKYEGGLNSFILPKDGNYDLEIYYEPQKWVNIGLAISGVTFILMIALAIGFRLRKMVK